MKGKSSWIGSNKIGLLESWLGLNEARIFYSGYHGVTCIQLALLPVTLRLSKMYEPGVFKIYEIKEKHERSICLQRLIEACSLLQAGIGSPGKSWWPH